ncbi:hypothetical protein [Rudanella lutea]|uniref:hypothetical protein n=1 Tax=Rudanella lutea TaxID=451374 RepID=UPI000486DA93|nr:hypothetical protein [Rudanella lutea]
MKTKLAMMVLIVGMSLQTFGMGHPHNLFAARKQIRAKRPVASQPTCPTRTKATAYAKATLMTSATVWTWLTKKGAN